MESPRHWYSIVGELLVKSCEGILESRIRPELRRVNTSNYNVVLQTVVTESQDLRDRIGFVDLHHNWSVSLDLLYNGMLVESWCFHYSTKWVLVRQRKRTEDLYKQAAVSLRAVLLLSRMLPAYERYRENYVFEWVFRDPEIGNMTAPYTRHYDLMACPAGSLRLKLRYTDILPQQMFNLIPAIASCRQGSSTPPFIDWWCATRLAISLEESSDSDEEYLLPLETLHGSCAILEQESIEFISNIEIIQETINTTSLPPQDTPVLFSSLEAACEELMEEVQHSTGNAELIEEYYKCRFLSKSLRSNG